MALYNGLYVSEYDPNIIIGMISHSACTFTTVNKVTGELESPCRTVRYIVIDDEWVLLVWADQKIQIPLDEFLNAYYLLNK
jgi:hypothetical protein